MTSPLLGQEDVDIPLKDGESSPSIGNLKEIAGDDQVSISADAFQVLNSQMESLLQSLSSDQTMIRYVEDFKRLFQALEESRRSEVNLISKIRQAQTELMKDNNKIQNAVKMSHTDKITIANLKKEVTKTTQLIEEANERDSKNKELIAQMKNELVDLQQTLHQHATSSIAQEQAVNELLRQKEELTKDRDMQVNQIAQLRAEIVELSEKTRDLENEKSKIIQEVRDTKDLLASKKAEADKELRVKERLERELKDSRLIIDQKSSDVRSKQEIIHRLKEEVAKLESNVRDQKSSIEKVTKESEGLQIKIAKLQQEHDDQVSTTNHFLAENQDLSQQLKAKELELSQLKDEFRTMNRLKESLQRKSRVLEEEKQRNETERSQLKNVSVTLEKDIETYKRSAEKDKRQIDDLTRERDIINRNLQKATAGTQKQLGLARIHDQTRKGLEQEISQLKSEISRLQKSIVDVQNESEKHVREGAQLQNDLLKSLDDAKAKENEIFEYKKKILETESKLKQQQTLYEGVRADRNTYSKNLVEVQGETNELKRKLKIMTHQADQLKDEIQAKNAEINREHTNYMHIEKEKESLKLEMQKLKQQVEVAEQYSQSQQVEDQKLKSILNEANVEVARRKKELDAIIQERDMLSAQLVRRNEELAQLYERVKSQRFTLSNGEIQYRDRLEEIQKLQLEIKTHREEILILKQENEGHESMKAEIIKLQKDILREKNRVKLLEEELEKPLNIHRWRKLEGTDPDQLALINKVRLLQKKLITKTEEVVNKELAIQEREKEYAELKKVLARQPGPELLEQVNQYQTAVKERAGQLKAMASELNMYQAQVSQQKMEIEILQREMTMIRKRHFDSKKNQVDRKPVMEVMPVANIDSSTFA